MLKALTLERIYRDSRSGALMPPCSTEIVEDDMPVLTLCDEDEPNGLLAASRDYVKIAAA